MSTLLIVLAGDRTAYRPGDEIVGTATWQFDRQPRSVETRLCWHTEGKGSRDSDVAATVRFDAPLQMTENREFRFTAPTEPHSFSGQILSLVWNVELEAEPGEVVERVEIVIGPGGKRIVLGKVEESATAALPGLR
jgi:hypothetical protein